MHADILFSVLSEFVNLNPGDTDQVSEERFFQPEIYKSGLKFTSSMEGRPRVKALLKGAVIFAGFDYAVHKKAVVKRVGVIDAGNYAGHIFPAGTTELAVLHAQQAKQLCFLQHQKNAQ